MKDKGMMKSGCCDRPTGEIGGADLPNRGVNTGVTDNYMSNLTTGSSGGMSIRNETKSDAWDRNLPMPAEKGKA